MKNSGNKRMMKQEEGIKNKIKACGDLDGGFDDMAKEIELRKRKDEKHLELEFIHEEQTPKEGINPWMK